MQKSSDNSVQDVRNMAKLFEQPADKKPPVASKPKPKTWVKPETSWTASDLNPNEDSSKKPEVNIGQKHRALNNALSPKFGNNKPSDTNNNKSDPSKETNSVPGTDSDKAAVVPPPKFPKAGVNILTGAVGKLPTLPKPTLTPVGASAKPDPPKLPAKVPLIPKTLASKTSAQKTESINSSSSNTSTCSTSSSPSSASPFPKSQQKENGIFDFPQNLRSAGANGVPGKIKLPSRGRDDTDNSNADTDSPLSPPCKSSSPPPLPASRPTPSPSSTPQLPSTSRSRSESSQNEQLPPPLVPKPTVNLVELRSKLKKKDVDIIERPSDCKKFRKTPFDKNAHSASPPEKPTLPTDIDLTFLRNQYEKAISDSVPPDVPMETEETEEADDIYDDSETVVDFRPPTEEKKRISERISMIPEMSPEEEEGAYDDTPADDIYTDGETPALSENLSYAETEQDRKKRQKEEEREKKDKEKQEKQKKKKEEREEKQRKKEKEKEEKQRKKKEEELVKLKEKFEVTDDKVVGDGEIIEDANGDDTNLKVRKGQKVTVVRINNNPPNKWLVKYESNLGYVASNIISLDPSFIKQKKSLSLTLKGAILSPLTAGKSLLEAMANYKKESSVAEDDQPTYDAVAENVNGGSETPIDELYEDVYEEFP